MMKLNNYNYEILKMVQSYNPCYKELWNLPLPVDCQHLATMESNIQVRLLQFNCE